MNYTLYVLGLVAAVGAILSYARSWRVNWLIVASRSKIGGAWVTVNRIKK